MKLKYLRNYFSLLMPASTHFLLAGSALVGAIVLPTFLPLVSKALVDKALGKGNTELFFYLLALFAIIPLLASGFFATGQVLLKFCAGVIKDLCETHLIGRFFASSSSPSLDPSKSSPVFELDVAIEGLVFAPLQTLSSLAGISANLIFLFFLEPRVAAVTVVSLGFIWIQSLLKTKRLEEASRQAITSQRSHMKSLEELISARPLIQQLYRESESMEAFENTQAGTSHSVGALHVLSAIAEVRESVLITLFGVAVVGMVGSSILDKVLTVGDFIAISTYIGLIQEPFRNFLLQQKSFTKCLPSMVRVLADYDPKTFSERKGIRGHLKLSTLQWGGAIRVEEPKLILKRESRTLFTGRPGEPISKVLELVSGASIDANKVYVGDLPLEQMPHSFKRGWASWIRREPQLLRGTFRECLCISGRHSKTQIERILRATGLEALIIGDGLLKLAEFESLDLTQRHRLSVARALLGRPEILLVEDFTPLLDPPVARQLLLAIESQGKTILAAGTGNGLLPLVENVIWIDQGVFHPAQGVEDFMKSEAAINLGLSGRLQTALWSYGAMSHAVKWANRNRVDIKSFVAEFFLAETSPASPNPGILPREIDLEALVNKVRYRFRSADLSLPAGKTKQRLVFFGNSAGEALDAVMLENKLIQQISDELQTLELQNVFFTVSIEDTFKSQNDQASLEGRAA